MIQLSRIKEKLSPLVLVFIALYLLAGFLFVAILAPVKSKTGRLHSEIQDLARNEQNIMRIVEQRPGLEGKQLRLEDALGKLEKDLPTQYDLPDVLSVLTELGQLYGLTIDELSHVPLKALKGDVTGKISLSLTVLGSDAVYSFLQALPRTLPTLALKDVNLVYAGDGKFGLAVQGDLNIVVVSDAEKSTWQRPNIERGQALVASLQGFGLPFERIAKFLLKDVKVLGVIEGNGQSTALLFIAGEKLWVKVGEALDDAVVTRIEQGAVFLDVDGVLLKLTIGG